VGGSQRILRGSDLLLVSVLAGEIAKLPTALRATNISLWPLSGSITSDSSPPDVAVGRTDLHLTSKDRPIRKNKLR
jgi:hypothetical protein